MDCPRTSLNEWYGRRQECTAVHGSMEGMFEEGVQLLIDMGCNPNVISTGEYNIPMERLPFCSLPPRRVESWRRGAIVNFSCGMLLHFSCGMLLHVLTWKLSTTIKDNNRNWVVYFCILSFNAPETMIQMIQQAGRTTNWFPMEEWLQRDSFGWTRIWWGFLDPRFLQRPLLSTQHVVVTPSPLAMNPTTTKESRRGAFLHEGIHIPATRKNMWWNL